ncbi:MAG: sugar ABC transporter ATP-binding protein [Eubacteriales bacterium]|nr:sugar ABC transporter ATP-binding protein [Eubacteriales bacterium]
MQEELILRNISKNYAGVQALKNVSIRFRAGEVHALIGENGAGKSTLIKVISGVVQPTEGEIEIFGETVRDMTPLKAIHKGIAVVHQEMIQFEGMTVADNVCMEESVQKEGLINREAIYRRTRELLGQFETNINPSDLVGSLSMANRQIVEIAKALNLNARVVIFDEPTASITVQEQKDLFKLIKNLKAKGITVLYISHRLEELAEICDRVSVMRDGEYRGTMEMAQTSVAQMINLMVGRELGNLYIEKQPYEPEVVLRAEHLSGNGVKNVSFELHRGEILGFAGLVGAGRTELMHVIYGAARMESGKLYLYGKETQIRDPADAIRKGIGMIPEDRKSQGVFLDKPIAWNITLASMKKFRHFLFVDRKKEREEAEKYQKSLRIKAASLESNPSTLSGGNQQKVVLAKTLSADPDIIIFDEPTRGVDVGARNEIYQLMVDLTQQGKSILMVSSDMSELIGMSENIVVLHEGELTGKLSKEEFRQNRILELASGIE